MTRRLVSQAAATIVAFGLPAFSAELPSDHRPVISPDGETIVFMSTREDGDWELFSIGIDGSDLKRVTRNPGWDGYAVWAPDGRSFIFDREVDGARGAYKYDRESDAISPFLVMDGARVAVSGWSTRNNQVVMFIERDGKRDLYVADSDGSDLEQLTDTPDANEHEAHYSPDGERIAFAVSYEGGSAIDVMNLATKKVSRLVSSSQNVYGLDWSPDGNRIAFTDTPNDDPDGNAELYLLDLLTGQTHRLTNDENYDHMPVWLPDGSAILFTSYASGREEIYLLDLESSRVRTFPSGLE
ncbi:MAG: hypothetical protein OEW35_14985 [Gammaproteobacteria bacterium]|nr:hypothetical protein [Gammaproteobacteria bacterium]MDH4255423.1 hypothetical protein [Gammaproteobacteria bacterium]MDH5310201.1 hypothetical protein [Gammaproteobacteria bacterium]